MLIVLNILGIQYTVDLQDRNNFKREYIQYSDNALMVIDSIIDSHADDGIYDELVDELNKVGYYNNIHKLDSMADTQL